MGMSDPNTLSTLPISYIKNSNNTQKSTIRTLGFITKVTTLSKGVVFTITDGTDLKSDLGIECTFFPSTPYLDEMQNLIELNKLVEVIGSVRVTESLAIAVNSIREVTDCNMFSNYLMECITEYLYYNNSLEDDIVEYLRKNQTDSGIHLSRLVEVFKDGDDIIKETLDELVTNCRLYVVDVCIYKTTD